MPISYSYSINSMSCYPLYNTENDVVFQVLWTLTGTNGVQTSSYSASTILPVPQGDDFTPYADLTEPQVIGWVETETDPEYLANAHQWIADDIAAKENPPVVTPPLPWAPEETPVEAEAEVPLAIAQAFRNGQLGIMDYAKYNNILADTDMRKQIGAPSDSEGSTKQ
jgi:hypothetical protein